MRDLDWSDVLMDAERMEEAEDFGDLQSEVDEYREATGEEDCE